MKEMCYLSYIIFECHVFLGQHYSEQFEHRNLFRSTKVQKRTCYFPWRLLNLYDDIRTVTARLDLKEVERFYVSFFSWNFSFERLASCFLFPIPSVGTT